MSITEINGGVPRALRQGDKGADVTALQKALGITADGDFGPRTDVEVRVLQAAYGLVVDGIVGAMTRDAVSKFAALSKEATA